MSRGFNYHNGWKMRASRSNDYEFTFEVYVKPYFESGFVPVNMKIGDFSTGGSFVRLFPWRFKRQDENDIKEEFVKILSNSKHDNHR